MAILNIAMGTIAVALIFLNYSAFFKDISFAMQVVLKSCLVAFILITCALLMYSFCNIRFLLAEYELDKKLQNDTMIFVHCFSFIIFNIAVVIMLGLLESMGMLLNY